MKLSELIIFLLTALAIGGIATFAIGAEALGQTTMPTARDVGGVMPDSILWRLDTLAEAVQLAFASPDEKVDLRLRIIQERFDEAANMAVENNLNEANNALKNADKHTHEVLPDAETIKNSRERSKAELKIKASLDNSRRRQALRVLEAKIAERTASGETASLSGLRTALAMVNGTTNRLKIHVDIAHTQTKAEVTQDYGRTEADLLEAQTRVRTNKQRTPGGDIIDNHFLSCRGDTALFTMTNKEGETKQYEEDCTQCRVEDNSAYSCIRRQYEVLKNEYVSVPQLKLD